MNQDSQIIALLIQQDFDGLSFFIEEYSESIYRTVYRILSCPNERNYVEDVVNEILYEVWQKIARFDSEKSSLQTWVLLLTRNRAIDWKRKLSREQGQADVDEVVLATEKKILEKESFLAKVDYLSETDQKIFLYYYFYQFSAKEIAQIMTCKTEQIFNRLSRGRQKLKILEEQGNGKL